MEKQPQTKGKCFYCEQSYGKGGMTKHLQSCKKRQEVIEAFEEKSKAKPTDNLHIQVQGHYNPQYWLHLEVSGKSKLSDLDDFLRMIWLECCGHLSMFEINGVNYSVSPMEEYGDRSMSYQIASILDVGTDFVHEYDFGSTTHLRLRVVDKRQGKPHQKIAVMARNFPQEIICQQCNKQPATFINTYAEDYETDLWLCDDCAPEDEEDSYYLLPNVNSPRVGVCGYEGPDDEHLYAT